MEFTNDTIDLSRLPRYEATEIQPLQPAYWNIIAFNLIQFLLSLAIAVSILIWYNAQARPYVLPVSIAYILLVLVAFLLYRMSFKKRGLAVREKDILFRSGLFSTVTTVVPFVRIQHVALVEGFLSRHYRLGSLEVFTAGGTSGHLVIDGLDIDEARKIKELLLNKVEQDA